jgi:hypothetical protein
MPLVTLKKDVSFFQVSTPVPVNPFLASVKLGPESPVFTPGVKVALVKLYKPLGGIDIPAIAQIDPLISLC